MSNTSLDEGLVMLDRRAALSKGLIALVVIFAIAVTAMFFAEVTGGLAITTYVADDLLLTDVVVICYGLVLIASFIVVSFWIHRAHANLRSADLGGLEYSPSWAIGWFVIPIANLFKPFQAMRELWNASHGAVGKYDYSAPALLWVWWLAWIGSSISSFGEEISSLDIVSGICTVVSAIALWIIIDTVTKSQHSMDVSEIFT